MSQKILRQSEIKTFLMCGKRWEFEYVLGLKGASRPEATIGSAVDTGVSKNLAQKVTSGIDLPLEEVLAITADDFDERNAETEWDSEDNPGQSKDHAVSISKLHHTIVAPTIKPKAVQQKFQLDTDAGFSLSGTLDYTTVDMLIGDTKTTSRAKASSFVVERSFQPALYTYATRALYPETPPVGFRFDVFTRPTKTLPAEYRPVSGVVTDADFQWLFGAITQVHKAIDAGIALPAPEGSWFCSAKWCPFWSRCKGRK